MNGAHAGPSDPYADARRRMVLDQLEARGIRDRRVLAAMGAVPRHRFVAAGQEDRAYGDHALPVAEGQTISQPWIVARMVELARVPAAGRVLEVGTGTGYQTAVLAALAAEVFSVERLPALLAAARTRLDELRVANARLHLGDGTLGWQEFAPYASVLAAAAAPHVPRALLDQLEEGGVLVIPVGSARSQWLEVWRRQGHRFLHERHDECRFVPLIGQDAWREDPHHN